MLQLVDIRWEYNKKIDNYFTSLRLRDKDSLELTSLALKDFTFNFDLSLEKYCIGYYSKNGFKPCPTGLLTLPTQTQCSTCERLQGFMSAFIFGQEPNEQMKEHLAQKHYIYLAYFQPNIIKVGTAAESRFFLRPIEQDALIYSYIAENDGFNIQKLEHEISKKLKITEFVKGSHKLKFFAEKINIDKAKLKIEGSFDKIKSIFKDSTFDSWLYRKINIVNLTKLSEIFYPEKETFLQKNELKIVGQYKGLRGKYLIIENDGNYFVFDIRNIIGRMVNYIDDWKYNLDMTQMKLNI